MASALAASVVVGCMASIFIVVCSCGKASELYCVHYSN